MADLASGLSMQQATRIKALTFPREHGAWGLLLIPLVTGALVGLGSGHNLVSLGLYLTAALAIFWLRTPIESYFGMGLMRIGNEEERRAVVRTIGYLVPVLAIALTLLFWGGNNLPLVLLGLIGASAFALQATLRLFGRKARLASQAAGSIGLTSTSAGAYYALTGHLDARAMAVWLACFLFAGDQLHYVQLRIRNAKLEGWRHRLQVSRYFIAGQLLMLAGIVAASSMELLPAYALIAFVPIAIRGFLWVSDKNTSLNVVGLGLSELAHGIAFGLLLTVTFFVH